MRWTLPPLLALAIFLTAFWLLDRPAPAPEARGLTWQLEQPAQPPASTDLHDVADPEALLRRIFQSLESGQRALALEQAQSLVLRHPNFQLAQG
ncbi:MAG: hypothetical protein ACKODC_00915, partial [Limnohabitans sp.]